MGSNNYYAVDVNIGSNHDHHHRSSSGSSSSSRKGRKNNNNNNSEKPKQPQRGLGVAQLEKIRLHGQTVAGSNTYLQTPSSSSNSSSSSYAHPQNFLMGFNEHNSANISFRDSQSITPRWNIGNGIQEGHHFAQPTMTTRHFFNPQEDVQKDEMNKLQGDTTIYDLNYKASCDNNDVDLELRL